MGSDVDQFLQQPFVPAAFGMTCFFGILFIVMVGIIILMRQRKARKEREAAAASAPSFATSPSFHEHDMPDLALLVSTPPAPEPQSVPLASLVQPAQPTAAAPRAARKGTFTIAPQDAEATEAVEVMTILRDVVDGRLIVQMGDKAYQNINASPEFKARFNRVMRDLGQMVTQSGSTPTDMVIDQPESTVEPEPPPIEIPTPEPPPAPKPRPAAPPPPMPSSGILPGDLPSFKLSDNPMVKPRRGQKLDLKPVPEINIAGAIEAYLQYKLQHSTDYRGHSIHIYPAPDGGVSIEVDGRYYEAVGDITDNNVREFIAQAIQEWQERH